MTLQEFQTAFAAKSIRIDEATKELNRAQDDMRLFLIESLDIDDKKPLRIDTLVTKVLEKFGVKNA